MVAPIDYRTQVASPFESALQGLKFGAGIAGMQEARQQKEASALAQRQQQEAINALVNNPDATAEDYAKLTLLAPAMQKQIKQSWDMHSEGEKKASLAEISSVYSALQANKPEIAVDILNRRVEALKNSNGPQDQIDAAERMAKLAETSPDFMRIQTGVQLAAIPGGDKIIESSAKSAETRRKEGLYPGEVLKQGADIGLTEAQTKKTLAEVDKLGAETKKAILDLEGVKSGLITDPNKRFDSEKKLRDEYVKRSGNFTESQRTYDNLKASASAGAAGDIALVTSFMKMLDPGSVVRETEFATARDTAGLLTRLQNIATSVQSGQFLSENQRKSFVSLAGKYMSAAEKEETGVRKDLEKVVKNYELNPENVFGGRAEGAQEQPVAGQTAPRVITVDY